MAGRRASRDRRDPVEVPAIAERLAAEIPGVRLTWLDDPDAYASKVLTFLQAI